MKYLVLASILLAVCPPASSTTTPIAPSSFKKPALFYDRTAASKPTSNCLLYNLLIDGFHFAAARREGPDFFTIFTLQMPFRHGPRGGVKKQLSLRVAYCKQPINLSGFQVKFVQVKNVSVSCRQIRQPCPLLQKLSDRTSCEIRQKPDAADGKRYCAGER